MCRSQFISTECDFASCYCQNIQKLYLMLIMILPYSLSILGHNEEWNRFRYVVFVVCCWFGCFVTLFHLILLEICNILDSLNVDYGHSLSMHVAIMSTVSDMMWCETVMWISCMRLLWETAITWSLWHSMAITVMDTNTSTSHRSWFPP